MGKAPSRREIPGTRYRGVDQCEHFGLYPNGKRCHVCGRLLGDAADEHSIFTRVSSGVVFLHPHCALAMGARLLEEGMRGVIELEEVARDQSKVNPSS